MREVANFRSASCLACFYLLLLSFGGILGWDPVLTTCILCEKVKLPDPPQRGTQEHESHHRVDHEKNCEAIYWKHHTSHHLTKNSHTITLKQSFFTKSSFLLGISKIPYLNQVELFSRYFYNSSHNILIISSSSHQEYMQCVPDPTPKYPQKNRKNKQITRG